MQKTAVYPGTFDPITYGHIDVVERAARIFDRVIVAVAASPHKTPFFLLNERVELARAALVKLSSVDVIDFNGLLIDFMRAQEASIILRGVRMLSDFDYEFQLAGMNKQLAPDIESIFLMPGQTYTSVSSSFVREIAVLGGDVSPFVSDAVCAAFKRKLKP